MVQRKADICNKPLLNNLKSSSSSLHHHHVKNNVKPDLKKKIMKRSGSIKRQELEADFERRRAYLSSDSTPQKQSNDREMTPNYMKSTSSSIARKEQSVVQASSLRSLTKNPCFKSTVKKRCSKVVLCENVMIDDDVVQKPTCSSTLKHRKFPAYLELSHGGTESSGTSVFKVCPYTYCSLNGHYHEPLPPLKLFLSAKRRAMKAQKSPKLNVDGSKEEESLIQNDEMSSRTDVITKGESMDCFKETEKDDEEYKPVCSDVDPGEEASDMELELNIVSEIYNNVEYEYSSEIERESEFEGTEYEAHEKFLEDDDMSQDSAYVDSDAFSCSSDQSETTGYDLESSNDVKAYEFVEPEPEEDPKPALNLLGDARSGITHADHLSFSTIEDQTSLGHLDDDSLTKDADQTSHQDHHMFESQVDNHEKESSNATDNCLSLSPMNQEKEPKPKIEIETRANQDSKKPIKDTDQAGDFNLRGPNFLPLEPDPDAEKVDLKHQEVDERKNSEEFMVDYALRQAVTKLAPARKRKVALLVEAFEKVMPASKCETQSTRFDDHARVVQACN